MSRCMIVTRLACIAHKFLHHFVKTSTRHTRMGRTHPRTNELRTPLWPLVGLVLLSFAILDQFRSCRNLCPSSYPRQFPSPGAPVNTTGRNTTEHIPRVRKGAGATASLCFADTFVFRAMRGCRGGIDASSAVLPVLPLHQRQTGL